MKIIWLTTQYPVGKYNRNGTYIVGTVSELIEEFDITVIALHPVIPPFLPMLKNLKNIKKIYQEWRKKFPRKPTTPTFCKNIKVEYSNYIRPPRPKIMFMESWGGYFSAKKIFKKIVDKETIIHANWVFPEGYLAMLLSKKFNIPYIITLRGSDFIDLNINNLNGKFAQKVFNSASKITSVSSLSPKESRDKGIIINKNKFLVLNDFYNFDQFNIQDRNTVRRKLKLSEDKTIILFPGALRKIKNIYSLLKAIKHFVKENYNIELLLAGYGYEEHNLKNFVKENDLTEHIKFLGNVDADTLITYYNAANLICLPSYSEGFPTVIVEALLCGTPIVASFVGGIPDIIKDGKNGFLIDPNSVNSLTTGIKNCIGKEWDRNKLRNSVSYLSKNNQIIKYRKLYNEVLNSNTKG